MKLLAELFKLVCTLMVFALTMPLLMLCRWLLLALAWVFGLKRQDAA